ncbi:MAG: tetratricopeptide repeat protein [Oscillospiraceae bacterium]|nr:tetratricopeptide repeat protein [Oscillospiraceae bacterium]
MDKNGNKSLNLLTATLSGFSLGAVIMLMLLSDGGNEDTYMMIFAGGMTLAAAMLFSMIRLVIEAFILPHNAKKKTAERALGKDGIQILRKDETARLAYKGIYALIDGKLAKSEEYLQQALSRSDLRQNQCFCVEWLIRVYDAMENDAQLMWCYRKAVEYSPDNAEAQSRLGHAYFADGQLDRAMYCFEQALRYDPNNGYSYFSIAKIQLIRGQDKSAFETLQKLVKINENHPLCHAELADYYAMQGDRKMAEEEVKKAQLCGIKEPEELNKRINAMLSFHETEFSGGDLPTMFYRKIEKPNGGSEVHSGGRNAIGDSGEVKG